MSTPSTPRERWEALIRQSSPQYQVPGGLVAQRYVTVQEYRDGVRALYAFDTERAALDHLAGDIMGGWMPLALIDLEIGEQIGLQVSIAVTRSESAPPMLSLPWEKKVTR